MSVRIGNYLTTKEHGIATDKSHNKAACQGVVSGEWLPEAFVREQVAIEALGVTGALPLDKCEGHDGEVDELAGGDEVYKPLEDDGGVAGDLKEGEEGDAEGYCYAVLGLNC